MVTWISWKDIKEELMQDSNFREGYAEELKEFKRQNAAELAAERVAIGKRTRTVRPAFSMSRIKQRFHRPATIAVRPAVEA